MWVSVRSTRGTRRAVVHVPGVLPGLKDEHVLEDKRVPGPSEDYVIDATYPALVAPGGGRGQHDVAVLGVQRRVPHELVGIWRGRSARPLQWSLLGVGHINVSQASWGRGRFSRLRQTQKDRRDLLVG